MAEFNVDDLPDLNEAKLINVDDLPDLKKKGDTIKSGSGFSMLSGTESKSKSPEPSKPTQSQTKAINTNPTMPDFGLKLGFPIQKPTINLKTTEQEQRIIKSKESNQTPQVFEDYRSVIQKGIQGQNKIDATFTPLSKPIIESQAKKEVQHLKEQHQAIKLAKKETHQNINAVIPELAQAKNTDEAISAILKSDMKDNFDMWQQFDDNTLLSNDETTLNDFLVKKGLKNADREAYLKGQSESNPKYQYEYERNNISSLFGAVAQRAKDYEDVLKNKFGDNYLQQANAGNENILNDTEFNTFISLKEKEKSLSTKANSLINDPRFSSIKKELDKNEDKQLKSDAIAKADKWYNPTDELRYVGSKVLYAAGKAVKMLAELPSLATSIDKGYDWTDKLADWGDRFSTDLIDAIPVSTDLKAGFNNKVAKVGNYKVIIDDNGEVADVRDNNNFKVSLDEMKSVTDKYNANPKGYKVNNEYNPRSLADNGLNTVIDMGLMILGTKGAGVLGAGEKMQKLTSMGIAYQQTKRDVFNDALKKGLDPKNADLLSNIIAVAAGASSSINPLEFNIASGKGLFNFTKTDGLNAGKLALIKEGKLSAKDYAKEFVKAGIKNTIGENIEELVIEGGTQAIANNYFNSKISATDKTDGGLDDKLHIFDKQGLETFLITAGTSLLMTPIEMKSQMLGNQQEALKLAIDNPIDFKKIRQIQVEKGQLTQDEVDKEAKIYEDVSRTYNASKDEIKEELKPQLLALLTKKYNIANKINEIKDDVLSAPYKAQLNDINKGIQDITNGIIPNESLVENTVTTTSVDDNNQEQEQEQDTDNNTNQSTIIGQAAGKGGVSILTKEKIRIANKISKGEDLTPEESDFYKAVKEDIDKITAGSITPTQQTTTSKLDNDVRLIEITPEDRKEMPKQLSTSQKKEYINLATQSEKDEYLLKIKQGNEQIQATPIESIEQGREQNDGTGLSETPKEEVEGVSGSALKDVESTVKAIEKNPSVINKIIGDEYYHGTSLPKSEPDFTTANKDKGVGVRSNAFMGTSREQKSPFFFITSERDVANDFAQAKKEYHDDKVKPNEKHTSRIIPFKFNEKNSKILDLTKDDYEFVLQEIGESPIDFFGMGMYEQDQMWEMLDEPKFAEKLKSLGYDAVKFIEPKRGIGIAVLNTDKIVNSTPKGIAEAYQKAKDDGSNPELVKAVEDLLTKAPTQYTEAATPKDDSAIQSGNEQIGQSEQEQVPTEKVEEKVKPIRQLGTGSNVYFETPKYRVNDFKGGKVLLNLNGDEDGGMAISNIEFDNVNEAVKVAEILQQDFPNGIPNYIDAEKYVQATRQQLSNANPIPTNKVNQPVSEVAKLKEKEQKNSQNNTKFDNNVTKSTDKTKTIDATTESGVRENTESSTEEKSEEKGANTKPTKRRVKGTPKSRRKVKHPEYLRALSHEPETATDIVLQAFISGAKIKADIIKKLYRNSGREIKQRIGLLSNGGYSTMAEMAHSLWEDQESFFGFEKFDSQEFENAIEDVLNSHTGTRSMVDELNNKFGLTADEKDAEEYAKYQEYEQKAEQEDLDEAIVYYESLTEEELLEIANAKDSAFIDDYVTYAEGKNNELAEERKQPADRTAKEIEAELKVKNAELKKLEEKQSNLNAQLEKNLKENQLDLLQGAKPQAMFDDKAEQQKIAEKSKSDIENKRKEIAKLNEELDNINQGEIPFQSTDKKFTTISQSKFNQLLDKLKKAFPNVKVELFGKSDFDNARKELEKRGIVVTDTKTKDGTIYGFKTPDGKVFLNSDAINANTPIHEFGHVWQSVFPNEFAKGISLLVQSPQGRELINEIRKNPAYKGKSITEIQAEALVTAIGNKGETIFNSNPTLYNKFKQWLNDLFAKIGDKLGIINLSPDDKFDMFTKKVVGELLGGKVLDSKVGTEKSTEKTITFQGQNIKVKEINGGAEVVNGFYSPLEKIINETKFEKLPAKQWVDKFAKGEEAKWTGLTEWLSQQTGSVSKADIQQFLKDNRIQVVEVVKGSYSKEVDDLYKKLEAKNKGREFDAWDVKDQDEWMAKRGEPQETKFSQYQLEGEKENYKEVLVTMPNKELAKKPKWNEKQVSLNLSSRGDYSETQKRWTASIDGDEATITELPQKGKYVLDFRGVMNAQFDSFNEAEKYITDKQSQDRVKGKSDFKSSHFDEPNILVHLRINTRTDAEGKKVLFIEEVQSDWGQKGKKEGFKEQVTQKQVNDANNKYKKLLIDIANFKKENKNWEDDNSGYWELFRESEEALDNYAKLSKQLLNPNTPLAPFVTDTNAWTKLGLKVALKEAVKQGADKIAWTTGEQQNDRYDLSKQVQSIEVEKVEEVPNLFFVDINMLNETATYNLKVENGIVREGTYKGQRLEDIVGKDVAEKILNNGSQTLRGDNLKVGGKGMKGFYGSPTEGSLGIVGNVAKSLFKQEPKTIDVFQSDKLASGWSVTTKDINGNVQTNMFDSKSKGLAWLSKQEELEVLSEDAEGKNYTTQHSITITPEMKAEVETGMPLFQYGKSELQTEVDIMRKEGMTDAEIRKFLEAIEQPKEEIDSVLGKQPKEKEKRLLNRAFKGTTDEELKSLIEDYGLTYDTESQIIAEEEANDIINKVGLEKAFQAVQNGYINGAQAAVVYAKMVDHIEAQLQKGNLSDEELVKLKELQAYTIDIFDNAARDAGRFIAMLKRVYHKSLFTYDAMVKSAENAKGTPLTEEERLIIKEQAEKIAELDKTIKELEEKLEQERAENAVQKIKADINKPKPTSVSFKAKAKAFADKIRGLKTKGLVLKDADGNPINITQNSIVSYNEIIEMVAKTIEKTGDVLEGITVALSEVKKQDWYQKLTQRDKDAVDKQIKQDILDLDEDVSDDKFKIPHSLIREIVKNGTEDIDGIVKKVLEVYHDIYPDLDERKVRDIITKYGEQKKDTRDDIDKKISEAKRIGRHLSGKEDLLNGKPPKRSGFKRDKPTPTERLLMQEIQQLLKNIPKSQEEIDNLWTTALEKAKTRITNRIEELQLAIDKKERINKTKNVQNYNDTDLDKLKDDLKAKQKEYDDLFPKEKTELSDEQRLIQSVNAKKKQLETLQSQKDSKVYERNKKDAPDRSKFPKLDKEIKDLDDKIKEIKEEIKQDDSWVKHIEKKRISLAIKANQRRIEEYRRRINEKDFVVVKNPTPISDELTKVRRERQKVADEYELAKYKYELENRTLGQKIFDGIFEGLQLSKQFVATADLSAPLRQGATVIFSNPIIWAKAFVDMHGQAFSHQTYKDSIDAIKNSKYYDLAQDSKLAITDADSINERKREEQFVSKLMDSNFMKKAPILAQYRQINKGSERAYSGFLNNIRFNLFEKGAKELEQAGYTFSDNPKMYKALATTINNLTGRGLSPSGNEGKFLNFVLFSPKMLTSRVLLMYDLLRTDIPLNSPSRKMAAKSLLGTITWVALFNVLGTMAANAFDDDDDDDDDVLDGLNKNPIATDFAKVRDKQTTFDPTAGYAPLVRTLARIITEKSINASGKEKDLSKGYGQTRFSPFWDFMENKLSPIASYGLSLLTHKNPQNKFEDASKAEWNDYITPLFVPLQAMQSVENFNDKDSFGKDFIEVALGLYGIGVAQYDNTSKGNKNANSQTGNRRTERDNTARTTNRRTER